MTLIQRIAGSELFGFKILDGANLFPADQEAVHETGKWTPEDHLEYGYQRIRQQFASELLAKIKDSSPAFFEKLDVELLVAMGYDRSR